MDGLVLCRIDNCNHAVKCKGLCGMHYQRLRNNGDPLMTRRRENGTGNITADGYIQVKIDGTLFLKHVVIAELALGKKLPIGAEVHHADGNRSNNAPSNLVICPSRAYHHLLHLRSRALDACGHADWRKCTYCKEYDDPKNMVTPKGKYAYPYHRKCNTEYSFIRSRERRAEKREA
jgi:hypothetical protein